MLRTIKHTTDNNTNVECNGNGQLTGAVEPVIVEPPLYQSLKVIIYYDKIHKNTDTVSENN